MPFFFSPADLSIMNKDMPGLGIGGAVAPPNPVITWDITLTVEFSEVTTTTWDAV